MPLTLLLDLDDTLLDTNLAAFVPAYFNALSQDLAPHISPELMSRALMAGMGLMNQSDDFSRTLSDIFYQAFYGQIPISHEELQPAIENFYDEIFPSLQRLTNRKPEAGPFVEWALSRGFRVAIATDPLLPRKATHHRLRWAGFEPQQFLLVSTFEEFHFSKTFPAYYAEVLGRIGWPEGPVLMVGNDLERDILPAQRLGLATFLLGEESASNSKPEAGWHGSFADLRRCLESADLAHLTPAFKSQEGVMGILPSTPAVLNGLLENFEGWVRNSSADDWTMTELICHLRDTEREVHQMQLKLFVEKETPFIPRPDTGVWASQRNYLHEDGKAALAEFNQLRRETIGVLKDVNAETWQRKARHAIFGPTTYLEVTGFMAEHDRLHIQQAWSILRGLS